MKKNSVFFVALVMAIFVMFGSSCKEADDCEGCNSKYVEYSSANIFYETYKSYNDEEKVLIDYRSADKFAAGHLPEAVNLPFETSYTDTEKEQWGKILLEKYHTKTCLFIYGSSSFELNKRVAEFAFRLGYGRENVRVFSKGYEELNNVWK